MEKRMKSAEQTMIPQARADNAHLEALLARVAEQDRSALAELYGSTRGAVYAAMLSYLKNADEAQDATQDAFLRIWENARAYRPRGAPMAWMLTVARNLAKMRLRQRARIGDLSEEEWQAIPAAAENVSAEDRLLLQSALGSLGEEERRVVLLHATAGLRHREIAQVLSLPLATVLSKYRRAVKKMGAHMEGVQNDVAGSL